MQSNKLITVSYRLPYRFSVIKSKLAVTYSAGGLATALTSYFENSKEKPHHFESLHWVGICDLSRKSFDSVSPSDTVTKDGVCMHPVFLSAQTKENFYDGFCNSTLWPLFLYFPSFVQYKKEFFDEYLRANQSMCEKIVKIYQPGDTIWIHDYHWMLLPTLLREALPGSKIGFFLHIPFPCFELYRLLPKPWRIHLLLGLIGSDVIGFQTDEYVSHFMDSIKNVMPSLMGENNSFTIYDRTTAIQSFPISIDYEKFSLESQRPACINTSKRIRQGIGVNKIILSVDRLDYTKAIFTRLESYAMFLEQNAEFHEKVSYILLMVPTRESILKYKENKMNVEALVSRINGKYGTLGWTPIVYQYQTVDFRKLVALYSASDIAFIVPYRDGMNLVAKEYVASRRSSDGVLILSETAGAASELREAILVNSNDTQEIADAIVEAMVMIPSDQKFRIRKMQSHLEKNDVNVWAANFLNSIERVNQTAETINMQG
ncbi:MAG: trehalose-6-phosphate synthase [Bacteroidota bacterium]